MLYHRSLTWPVLSPSRVWLASKQESKSPTQTVIFTFRMDLSFSSNVTTFSWWPALESVTLCERCSQSILYCITIDSCGNIDDKMLQLHCILQKWFKGCKGLKTLRFEVLDFFIIQPKLDVNPACGVNKFSPLNVYEVFVFRDLKRAPGSAHDGKKCSSSPYFCFKTHVFVFFFRLPLTDFF